MEDQNINTSIKTLEGLTIGDIKKLTEEFKRGFKEYKNE